jgi:hypothetical protein
MPCNFCSYLIEQEVACRRAYVSANRSGEWESVAEILLIIRRVHIQRCEVCQAASLSQSGKQIERILADHSPESDQAIFGEDELTPTRT